MLHLALKGTMDFGTDRVQPVWGAFQVPELNKLGVGNGPEWFPPGGQPCPRGRDAHVGEPLSSAACLLWALPGPADRLDNR